eukprot:6212003-Prymnesium_polylepis.1
MSPHSLSCSARLAPSDHNLARLARHVASGPLALPMSPHSLLGTPCPAYSIFVSANRGLSRPLGRWR